ncbi:MAG: FISUMP domain-containing protein [Bacteroidales bacterium]
MKKSIFTILAIILSLHCFSWFNNIADTNPTANTLPNLGPFACYIDIPLPNVLDVTGETSDCGGLVTVTFVSDGMDPICAGTVVRTYNLTDACGNSANITQNITILDNVAPTADPLPGIGPYSSYSNIPAPNIQDVTGEVDNCIGLVTVTFLSDGADPGYSGTVVRTYSLLDGCGNQTNITQNITIFNNQQQLTILYPNGGEILYKGTEYTINWNSQNISGNIQIDLYKGNVNVLQLAAAEPNTGNYPFNPPTWLTDGNDYKIGISAINGSVSDFSDNTFAIATSQTGSITNIQVTPRTNGSGLVDVYFDLNGPISDYYISLEASFNTGNTYTPIASQFVSGDVGPISTGTNKHIIWNGLQSSPNTYSSQTKLKVITNPGVVTDIDGNIYQTVTIGTQTWMKENLKTTKYRNGTNIEYPGSNTTTWQNNTTGAYAWYDNDISWKNTYGTLYNWHAVNNTNGLCPTGWHVPSDTEWSTLTTYLGGASIAGGKLKETGTTHWYSPNEGATNESGFTALPGGGRFYFGNGVFNGIGSVGHWWSSTEYSANSAWNRFITSNLSRVSRENFYGKGSGFSVRCVKD